MAATRAGLTAEADMEVMAGGAVRGGGLKQEEGAVLPMQSPLPQ